MKHYFTTNDLVRYLYKEVSFLEKAAIEKALLEDAELQLRYEELQQSEADLSAIELQPSNNTLAQILKYSESSRFEAEAY